MAMQNFGLTQISPSGAVCYVLDCAAPRSGLGALLGGGRGALPLLGSIGQRKLVYSRANNKRFTVWITNQKWV